MENENNAEPDRASKAKMSPLPIWDSGGQIVAYAVYCPGHDYWRLATVEEAAEIAAKEAGQ